MARIVPAKIIASNSDQESMIRALESGLDDSHVIIQRGLGPGVVLIAHPQRGLCVVACISEPSNYDPDAETWQGADSAVIKDAAQKILGTKAQVPLSTVIILAGTPRPPGNRFLLAAEIDNQPCFMAEQDQLPLRVETALQQSSATGIEAVDVLIQSDSPGAAAYVQDWITEPQRRWREAGNPAPGQPNPEEIKDLEQKSSAGQSEPVKKIAIDDILLLLLRQAVETVAGKRVINVQGIEIDSQELTDPDFMLPALLVAAALDWACVVVHRGGQGGFHFSLVSDSNSIVGYRVESLQPSAPLLLLLPVVDRIRRSIQSIPGGGERIVMDSTLNDFARWLDNCHLDSSLIDEIDMRIALQVTV